MGSSTVVPDGWWRCWPVKGWTAVVESEEVHERCLADGGKSSAWQRQFNSATTAVFAKIFGTQNAYGKHAYPETALLRTAADIASISSITDGKRWRLGFRRFGFCCRQRRSVSAPTAPTALLLFVKWYQLQNRRCIIDCSKYSWSFHLANHLVEVTQLFRYSISEWS